MHNEIKNTADTYTNVEMMDDVPKNPNELKIKYYCRVINQLKSATFKDHIMKEAKEVFYDPNFLKKLNKNKFLIGFKNGIYDLKQNIFREGLPDDYISMSLGVEYKEFSETSEEVIQVYDFFEKIFPDKELRDFFLSISSDVFVGGNQNKKVYFWSGEGDNGKSMTQLIFEKMLGDYAKKLPTSIITGRMTQSSAATPELARLGNGVRLCVADEPDKKDELNIGTLKRLSGNDTLYVRAMFKEGEEMEPMFKLIVICNDPPKIPQSDKATWNRIRVFPFESTFCDPDKCPITYEEQLRQKKFPKDPYFEDKIPGMLEAFAWVLLNHRKKNLPRYEPKKVCDATEVYRVKNDIYKMFINDMLVKDEGAYVTLYDLYINFKGWYKESMPAGIPPSKEDLKEYLNKNYSTQFIGNTKLKGFRCRTRDDEFEDV
jgi:P4 family phage/plasmid primase-like protien